MISTVWDIIFLSITIVFTLISVTIVKDWWTRVNPVAWKIVSVYAITGSTLTLTSAIYGMIQTAVEWDLADCMLLTIAVISVSMLICLITERLDRNMEDLGLAVTKLCGMQTAFRRLDPLLYSKECNRWLKSVDRINSAYDFRKEYWFILIIARQMLNRANGLVQKGDELLYPKCHFWGTMKFYKKQVIDYIKARDNNSSRLLGIWGMGGVGKSSLLKLVRDSRSEYDDDGSFNVLFVRAGSGCTVGQLQEAIATALGLCLSKKKTALGLSLDRNETAQAKIIHDHLKGTSFLLLLDDIWEYINLKAVGIPWPFGTIPAPLRGGSGSVRQRHRKVVLTSRNQELCHDMGCLNANIIEMQCFSGSNKLYRRDWSVINNDVVIPKPDYTFRRKHYQDYWLTQISDFDEVHKQELGAPLLGMEGSYKKVCCFLEAKGAQFLLLGIWGMRGVGKTALLRSVRDSYTRSTCFDYIMFVGAGTGCVVNNVQHAIAINLGLDWGAMSSSDELSRAQVIFDHLKDKSFLLLLDDIRDPLNWWAIGLPLLSDRRQKVILVTRSEDACALMGCDTVNTIEMECLEENDSWELFKGKVQLDDHPQVHHFAKQMVSMCEGLPLAICSLGRAMSNKRDPREWRSVYSQLRATNLKPSQIDEKVDTMLLYTVPEKPSDNTNPPEDVTNHGQGRQNHNNPGIDFPHGHLRPHEMNRDLGTQNLIAGWTPPPRTFTNLGAGRLGLPS